MPESKSLARAATVLAAVLILSIPFAGTPARAEDLDTAVLAEMNYVRAHPAEYAAELRRAPGWVVEQEEEGAVGEAIAFLEGQSPLPPLKADRRIAAAAREHAAEQAESGEVGHGGAGNLGQRLHAAGVYAGLTAETIAYGHDDARAVVRQLIIDSRVAGRGHRRTIFGPAYSLAGVACGPHRRYGAVCVIDFAGALVER